MIRNMVLMFCFVDIVSSFNCLSECTCRTILNLNTLICPGKKFNAFPKEIDNGTQFLRFEGNEITEIPRNLSNFIPDLQIIDLSENRVARLETRAFANLKNLRTVKLLKNKINQINDFIFEGVDSLRMQLNLRDNNISSISKDAFTGLYADTYLDLGKNFISLLHPSTFNDVRLLSLKLDNNQFTTIPSGLFKKQGSLFNLKLRDNKINRLESDSFTGLSVLETLDMSVNELSSLPPGVFANHPSLRTVKLSWNKFNYPPQDIPKNVMITLKDNPIICDCQLKQMLSNNDFKSKLKDIDQVICVNNTKKTTVEVLSRINCETTTVKPATTGNTTGIYVITTVPGSNVGDSTKKPAITTKKRIGSSRKSWPIVLGVALGILVLVIVAVLFIYLYRRLIAEKIYEAATLTLTRKKNRAKSCTTSTDDLEFHGWNDTSTAMLAKTEGNNSSHIFVNV